MRFYFEQLSKIQSTKAKICTEEIIDLSEIICAIKNYAAESKIQSVNRQDGANKMSEMRSNDKLKRSCRGCNVEKKTSKIKADKKVSMNSKSSCAKDCPYLNYDSSIKSERKSKNNREKCKNKSTNTPRNKTINCAAQTCSESSAVSTTNEGRTKVLKNKKIMVNFSEESNKTFDETCCVSNETISYPDIKLQCTCSCICE